MSEWGTEMTNGSPEVEEVEAPAVSARLAVSVVSGEVDDTGRTRRAPGGLAPLLRRLVRSLKLVQVHRSPALNLYSSAGKPCRVPGWPCPHPGRPWRACSDWRS